MRSILLDVGRKAVFSMLVGLAVIAASAGGFITRAANFNHLDRTLLAEYRVLGRDRVPLVIAAQPARMVEVVKVIGALGGEIVSLQDDIGYLYVHMKLDNVDAVEKIAGIDAMEVACVPIRSPGRVFRSMRRKGFVGQITQSIPWVT